MTNEKNAARSRMYSETGQAVELPTLDEVKKALKELTNGKAAGKDEIPRTS